MTSINKTKVGDLVRVVMEGEVSYAGQTTFRIGDIDRYGNVINPDASHVVSIEVLLPALPTTAGSLIRSVEAGSHRILGEDGLWYLVRTERQVEHSLASPAGRPRHELAVTDVSFRRDNWEIVYDAGKKKK